MLEQLTNRPNYVGDVDPLNYGGTWYDVSNIQDGEVAVMRVLPSYREGAVAVEFGTVFLGLPLDASNPRIAAALESAGVDDISDVTPVALANIMHEHWGIDRHDGFQNMSEEEAAKTLGGNLAEWLASVLRLWEP